MHKKPYSFSCDVWSAGAVLFAMLLHKLPFKTREQTINNEELDFNKFEGRVLSIQVRDLISGMLIKNPAKRLTIEMVLEHPWLQDY